MLLRSMAALLALMSGICVARSDELRPIKAKVSAVHKTSGWKKTEPGLILVEDDASYQYMLRMLYGDDLARRDREPFDERYVYLYIFAGRTNAGNGNDIEAVVVRRFGPTNEGSKVSDTIQLSARIIMPRAGDAIIQVVFSPWVLVKVEKASIPGGELTTDTRFTLKAERFAQRDTVERTASSPWYPLTPPPR